MTEVDIADPRYAAEELVIGYLTQVCHPISLQLPSSSLTTQSLSFPLAPVEMFRGYIEDACRVNWQSATAYPIVYGCPVRNLTLWRKAKVVWSGTGAEPNPLWEPKNG